ncbi:hypothetical protein OkiPb00202_35140 [Escherichia coli]
MISRVNLTGRAISNPPTMWINDFLKKSVNRSLLFIWGLYFIFQPLTFISYICIYNRDMLKCYSDVIRRVKCVKPQHELLKRRTRFNQIDVYSINLEKRIALFAKAVSIN